MSLCSVDDCPLQCTASCGLVEACRICHYDLCVVCNVKKKEEKRRKKKKKKLNKNVLSSLTQRSSVLLSSKTKGVSGSVLSRSLQTCVSLKKHGAL